ncbi:MAG TPA: PrsW family intramembrane metalloprotease [Pseudonocardiaceae bacterium]
MIDALPPQALERTRRRKVVWLPVLGMLVLGMSGLTLLGLATSRVGVAAVLVGAVAALLPVATVVGAFMWVDRWEPEPPKVMLVAFLWGACIATVTSLAVNDHADIIGELVLGMTDVDLVRSVVVAPVAEELTKGLFLLGLLLFRRHEFNGLVDGVVYAGMVAAGFAFTENIFYFGRAFAESGLGGVDQGVVGVFILRGVFAPFAHPLFTTMIGLGAGVVAASRRPLRWLALLGGFLLAVLLHALWNGSATIGNGVAWLNFYFLVMVPVFAGVVWLVIWQRRREQRVVAGKLRFFAERGWIAPSEVPLLGSLAKRRRWRLKVLRRSGPAAARAVTTYQNAVTALAFLYHRIHQGAEGPETRERHDQLLTALQQARAEAVRAASKASGGRPRRNRRRKEEEAVTAAESAED